MKKIVHYVELWDDVVVGKYAFLVPIDHPDYKNVSNDTVTKTSTVVSYDPETGTIETKNTIYVKQN